MLTFSILFYPLSYYTSISALQQTDKTGEGLTDRDSYAHVFVLKLGLGWG